MDAQFKSQLQIVSLYIASPLRIMRPPLKVEKNKGQMFMV